MRPQLDQSKIGTISEQVSHHHPPDHRTDNEHLPFEFDPRRSRSKLTQQEFFSIGLYLCPQHGESELIQITRELNVHPTPKHLTPTEGNNGRICPSIL